ncbi:MAG: pilus assembly protein TadG-related protein [Actinomycetota bacterium]|nr:pilus assembly protein TadG-related protein [Actinomycetota bacterium]
MTVLLGMSALVLDMGSWWRSDRALQQTVDAAALAGAQELPQSTSAATARAVEYADKNGGGLGSAGISFAGQQLSNDTIKVNMTREAPGFFSKVFGLESVTVRATASARAGTMSQAQYAAPIGVNLQHPYLSGTSCPCFNQNTTLELGKLGPGGFDLLNIDGSRGGTGSDILAGWMRKGYEGFMPLDWYYSDPGAKFESRDMQDALATRVGDEMLFPIYRELRGQGSSFEYEIVGWVGFHLTSYSTHGNKGTLTGWFTHVIWQGIQGSSGSGSPNFGARSVQLVD